jgi:hypothetical protein
LRLQYRHQIAALHFGIAEGQRRSGSEMIQHHRHRVQTLRLFHLHKNLFDLVGAVLCFHFHSLRILHELRGQLGNAFGIGGREQQGLSILRTLPRNGGNVIKEAHVEHAIGFIEHQCFKSFEFQRATLQMIHDAARRAHHHMRAVLQAQHLATQSHATTQGDHFHIAHSTCQAANFLTHLIGQLTCRAQDHGLNGKVCGQNFFYQWNAKRGRLAAASTGLGNQIFARQGHRQTGRLNGRHLQIAQLL